MIVSPYHKIIVDAGGFGSYMLAMDQKTYVLIDYLGNRVGGFIFVVSLLGLFVLVALFKVLDSYL
jgi:hypothetical protein